MYPFHGVLRGDGATDQQQGNGFIGMEYQWPATLRVGAALGRKVSTTATRYVI